MAYPVGICVLVISVTKYTYLKLLSELFGSQNCTFKLTKMKCDNVSQKNSDKNFKTMFCDTYAQRHKTPLCCFLQKYVVKNNPPSCTLCSPQLFIKYIVKDKVFFGKNGIVGFLAFRYLCHKQNIFLNIFICNFGLAKSCLKLAKMS